MIRKCFYKPNRTNDDMQPVWEDAYFIEFTHTVNMEDKVISWAIIQHDNKLKRVLINNVLFDAGDLYREEEHPYQMQKDLSYAAGQLSKIADLLENISIL